MGKNSNFFKSSVESVKNQNENPENKNKWLAIFGSIGFLLIILIFSGFFAKIRRHFRYVKKLEKENSEMSTVVSRITGTYYHTYDDLSTIKELTIHSRNKNRRKVFKLQFNRCSAPENQLFPWSLKPILPSTFDIQNMTKYITYNIQYILYIFTAVYHSTFYFT